MTQTSFSDETAFLSAITLGVILLVMFFIFCYKTKVLSCFGRSALSWKNLILLSVAAIVPACGMISSIFITLSLASSDILELVVINTLLAYGADLSYTKIAANFSAVDLSFQGREKF